MKEERKRDSTACNGYTCNCAHTAYAMLVISSWCLCLCFITSDLCLARAVTRPLCFRTNLWHTASFVVLYESQTRGNSAPTSTTQQIITLPFFLRSYYPHTPILPHQCLGSAIYSCKRGSNSRTKGILEQWIKCTFHIKRKGGQFETEFCKYCKGISRSWIQSDSHTAAGELSSVRFTLFEVF